MYWWGEPWPSAEFPAPVCADPTMQVPTPVGQTCLFCEEEIAEGDRGELIGHADGVSPVHRECMFRRVMGGPAHVKGTCSCQGGPDEPDLGMTKREAAIWVWERLTRTAA